MIGSKLLVRKIFIYQAVTPLIYNLGIILGAIFLSQRFGIYSLVIGVLAGVILGPAALNAFGAARADSATTPSSTFAIPRSSSGCASRFR